MIHVEIHGKHIEVREISDQWGEDTHVFLSRPALMDWVHQRYAVGKFEGTEEERTTIIERFSQI